MNEIRIPLVDDLHVHLRQGEMMNQVTPAVMAGGVGRCLVMPNTDPPILRAEQAARYRDELMAIDSRVSYLMSYYLHPELTVKALREAKQAGVAAVKCYPKGVTTNSDRGVEDLSVYDGLFDVMAEEGLLFLIHGEVPGNAEKDICILNAEQHFLPELAKIHERHPELRIVLEHVTTQEAVACVQELGEKVAATLTVHHLDLTADDWAGRNHNFCKPVAKYPHDRDALRDVVCSGHPRFFLGSDSAPHPRSAKEGACGCAGVFTAPYLMAYYADVFERMGCLERLHDFACRFGHQFYGLDSLGGEVHLVRDEFVVPAMVGDVVPFRTGERLNWRVASVNPAG